MEDADVKDDVKMASKWRGISIYMGTTRHFHVVFDVRVLDLNLSIISTDEDPENFAVINLRGVSTNKSII